MPLSLRIQRGTTFDLGLPNSSIRFSSLHPMETFVTRDFASYFGWTRELISQLSALWDSYVRNQLQSPIRWLNCAPTPLFDEKEISGQLDARFHRLHLIDRIARGIIAVHSAIGQA